MLELKEIDSRMELCSHEIDLLEVCDLQGHRMASKNEGLSWKPLV